MRYLYVFLENKYIEDVLKYGMKLSEFSNKILTIEQTQKSGIIAYLSPKDSNLYEDEHYSCVKILRNNLNGYIYNNICSKHDLLNQFICEFDDYELGSYEEPIAFITSTILPENIQLYDKIRDVPLLIENSKEFYYEKSIHTMLDNQYFSNYELYQILLILGEQKKIFQTSNHDNIKVYHDTKSSKNYTKKSSF